MDDGYVGYITKFTFKKNIGLGKEKKKTHWWRTLISNTVRKERKKSAPNYEASHEVGPVIFPFFFLFFFFFWKHNNRRDLTSLGQPQVKLIGKARNFSCRPLDLKFEPRTWAIPTSNHPLVTGGPVKKT